MNGQNLNKFYIHIIIDKMYVWFVNRIFSYTSTEILLLVVDMVM